MTLFREIFQNKHVILPVIHVESVKQTLTNVDLAVKHGSDGVFLINHSITTEELHSIHNVVSDSFPDFWVGVNFLGVHPRNIFYLISDKVKGVWVDNAMIDERSEEQYYADEITQSIRENNWKGLYFGGVAFKYQKKVNDLKLAAEIARNYMDVVTTSGIGTGKEADIEKIKIMKNVLGDYPLAIASGITPRNVRNYLDYADCFLVSTGISKNFTELDSRLLEILVKIIRSSDN